MKRFLIFILALTLGTGVAFAESVTFDGTITAAYTREIYADNSAVVETLNAAAGQRVEAGDSIAILRTTKVYAEQDGTVAAILGGVGASADTLVTEKGAVLYLESPRLYTINASTQYAYSSVETKRIRLGAQVALRASNDQKRVGKGEITAMDGTNYTVEVTEGDFIVGETVLVYQSDAYKDAERLGRGSVAQTALTAVTATGRIVSLAVAPGDEVHAGDLLLETLPGTGSAATITADIAGTVAQVNVAQGSAVEENAVIAVIWPDDAMQAEIAVSEGDLPYLALGDTVTLSFDWDEDGKNELTGEVTSIAAAPIADSSPASYTAIIRFTPTPSVRYGMSVNVATQP